MLGDAVTADLSWPARQSRGVKYLSCLLYTSVNKNARLLTYVSRSKDAQLPVYSTLETTWFELFIKLCQFQSIVKINI